MLQKRVKLFGLVIDDVSLNDAMLLSKKSLENGMPMTVFTPNLEMLSMATKNSFIRETLNGANLHLPDGYSLKIVARLLGKGLKNTVAGIDYGKELLKLCSNEGRGVFLLGGKRGVSFRAGKNLKKEMPNLQICGVYHGYFAPSDVENLIKRINLSGAEVIFVCLGFPKQEIFAARVKKELNQVKIVACLGGALDVWAGDKARAPVVFRQCHAEWLWRVLKEPKRAGRVIKSADVFLKVLSVAAKSRA